MKRRTHQLKVTPNVIRHALHGLEELLQVRRFHIPHPRDRARRPGRKGVEVWPRSPAPRTGQPPADRGKPRGQA